MQQSYSILVFGFFLRTDTNWFDCLATIQQVEERLHCMLCQVYVLSQTHLGDDDVWSMLGKEKVIFPSKKAGVVTQVLERFEKQAVAARLQVGSKRGRGREGGRGVGRERAHVQTLELA